MSVSFTLSSLSLPISQSTAESPEIEIFLDSGNDEDTGSAHSTALHSSLTVRATVSPLPTTHSNGKSRRQNDFFNSQPHSSPYPTESQDTFCSTEQNSSPADDELPVPTESQNEIFILAYYQVRMLCRTTSSLM